MEKTLYYRLKEAGCETDSHQSDLYVIDDDTSRSIIEAYEAEEDAIPLSKKMFKDNREGRVWFELPFAFTPYWERVKKADKDYVDEEPSGFTPKF